ncbi:response regulator transcription factor [Haloimpatiens sp. FM7315]|uniref:response regulator transcription factor n=1 Tax=Haloimpatiens sp. FM7315 TaxID=3298609 RepID=UPI0035A36406
MKNICILEDEKELNDILSFYLKENGYNVYSCLNLKEAYENIHNNINIWVIDLMLPDGSGFDLLKDIKTKLDTPVILISARSDSIDRVLGFEMGCDEYISKPFLPKELIYRIKNLSTKSINKEILVFKDFTIDIKKRTIKHNNEEVNTTSREYNLIMYFIENKGIALSREQIINQVWAENFIGNDRVVDNFIKKIRNKAPFLNIETIYGFGYRCNL